MYLSFNWLKEFIDLPHDIKPSDIADKLTLHTVEVEGVLNQKERFANVVVGKILKIEKHPNADRLQLTEVDTGDKVRKIVCGAHNIEVGNFVPTALPGAVLPQDFEIKEAKVRGELSEGMLCAKDELELGDDHSGIMILEAKAKPGQSLADYLSLDDVVLEVDNKSLSNRPDLWGHYGIAREISGLFSSKLKDYEIKKPKQDSESKIKVKVEDTSLCLRYMALVVDNIKVESSPHWLEERLLSCGVRPINNIVDITNYVMLELGQPLHAFDTALIDKIVVRRAKQDEFVKTLDQVERKLTKDDLVVADSDKVLAVAGVMGSENSEINQETTSIIIESANFNSSAIRKTSQRLNLRTEASSRFEKGLDPNLAEQAIWKTAELVKKLCPEAQVSLNLIDEKKFELNQGPLSIKVDWLNKRMGLSLDKKKIISILENLGFVIEVKDDILQVKIPTWRATKDISIPEDIVEEILRIYGFDNIPGASPLIRVSPLIKTPELELRGRIKDFIALRSAFTEVYNYSFVSESDLKKMGTDYSFHLKLLNPLSLNFEILRQSLIPGFINNVKLNQSRFKDFSLFEIGSVFFAHDGENERDLKEKERLPHQEDRLGMLIASDNKKESFSKLKGVLETLFIDLGLEVYFLKSDSQKNTWTDDMSADIYVKFLGEDELLGYISVLSKKITKSFGLKKETVLSEIYLPVLNKLLAKNLNQKTYKGVAKFPALVRDLAFVVDKNTSFNDLRAEILNFNSLICGVEFFDEYVGDKILQDKKSLAFRIKYQAEKTLVATEVDDLQEKLFLHLSEKFEAKLRDF